jgi:hypothetical protein
VSNETKTNFAVSASTGDLNKDPQRGHLPTMPDPSRTNPETGPHLPTMPDPRDDPERGQELPAEPDPAEKPPRINDPLPHDPVPHDDQDGEVEQIA